MYTKADKSNLCHQLPEETMSSNGKKYKFLRTNILFIYYLIYFLQLIYIEL